jgi:ribosomal protein S27E
MIGAEFEDESMSIAFQCPGCAKRHVLDEGFAGSEMACAQCGRVMQVPGPGASASSPETIRFRCEGCGKTYATPSRLAGKTIACKSCGKQLKIPGEPVSSGPSTASARRPSPATAPKPAAPPPPDIFGFEDEPLPPRAGHPPAGDGESRSRPVVDEGAPPPRAGGFQPLSQEQKKKIARRAAKVDKSKTSYAGAGFGVSFGTVLMITLFCFRWYNRISNRIDRHRHDANRSAPANPRGSAVDSPTTAAESDRSIEEQIKQPGTAEAREWLDAAKHPNHVIMEMPAEKARALVAGFYERGAEAVYVLDPSPLGNSVVAAMFAVKLPQDPARRKECLDWETRSLQAEEPTQDMGQKYLMITTD